MNKSKTLIALAAILVAVSVTGLKQAKALEQPTSLADSCSSNQTVSGTVKGKVYIVKNGTNVPLKYIKVRVYQRVNGSFVLKDTVLTNEKGEYSNVFYFGATEQFPEVKIDPITTYWENQGYKIRNAATGWINPWNPLILNFVGRK